jgi:lipooligosaccharide transport system permease protein
MALTGAALVTAARHYEHGVGKGGPTALIQRNFVFYKRSWVFFLTGLFEPIFYLFSIGIGVGAMLSGFEFNGAEIDYTEFVAPAMLATAAMNGAVIDSTFQVFFKLKFVKLYDAILSTSMEPVDVARGEVSWAVMRGAIYSAGFLVVMLAMGLVGSWWAVLALPAAVLIGFAFSGTAMALTTFMRSWQDFEYVQLAIVPMFLFSATFFPLSTYDGWLRWIVECTPLYRGVVLVRELCTGLVTVDSAISVVYLLVMGAIGTTIASRRLGKLLLT